MASDSLTPSRGAKDSTEIPLSMSASAIVAPGGIAQSGWNAALLIDTSNLHNFYSSNFFPVYGTVWEMRKNSMVGTKYQQNALRQLNRYLSNVITITMTRLCNY